MTGGALNELIERWSQEAEVLRTHGASEHADALRSATNQLCQTLERWRTEPLTIPQAAEWSGYSESQLRRLVRDGKLSEVGGDGPTQVRRCDLPRHPNRGAVEDSAGDSIPSEEQMARSVLESD